MLRTATSKGSSSSAGVIADGRCWQRSAERSPGRGREPFRSPHSIRPVRVTYDPTVDAAYIYLADSIRVGEVAHTEPGDPGHAYGVNLDFAKDGRLLGIEVLDASKRLPETFLWRFANRFVKPS